MRAYKCDRCGILFEANKTDYVDRIELYLENDKGDQIVEKTVVISSAFNSYNYELCDYCKAEFNKWWRMPTNTAEKKETPKKKNTYKYHKEKSGYDYPADPNWTEMGQL